MLRADIFTHSSAWLGLFLITIIISAFGTDFKTPFCQFCGFGSGTFLTGWSETELFFCEFILKTFSLITPDIHLS